VKALWMHLYISLSFHLLSQLFHFYRYLKPVQLNEITFHINKLIFLYLALYIYYIYNIYILNTP